MTNAEKNAEWERIPTDVELAEMLKNARRPGILLLKSTHPDDEGLPGCWLGGEPNLPPEIDWPMVETEDPEYPEGPHGVPMHFIGQLDLALLPRREGMPALPQRGTLFFFYDPVHGPVYDPFNGFERVIYVEGDVSDFQPRAMPDMPPIDHDWSVSGAYVRNPSRGYKKWSFSFSDFDGYAADVYRNRVFEERVAEKSIQLSSRVKETLAGRATQDAENACSVFAHHHFLGSNSRSEPVGDYVRLLAVKHDRDIGFDFAGNWVVFWISTDDLKAMNFGNAFSFEEYQ